MFLLKQISRYISEYITIVLKNYDYLILKNNLITIFNADKFIESIYYLFFC